MHGRPPIDLKGLRAFCSVAEFGSFSRAATALGVAQSVLSRQVSALELELGGRLLYRSGRGATATELGRTVQERAKSLLTDADQLLLEARGVRDNPAGSVNLGVVPAMTSPLVSELSARLWRDYPLIRLRVYEAYSGQIEDWLASGHVEIGLFQRFRAGKVRAAEKVLESEMMLVTPRGHAATQQVEVAFRAIGDLPLALPVRLVPVLRELAARQHIELNIVLEGSTSSIIMDAVGRSKLCGVFARHNVDRLMKSGRFSASRIVRPALVQTTWLALSSRRPATAAVRVVAALVRDTMLKERRAKG
ncbi:MAG TPA: LysR family transcriptional regulator [Burkholderiales bacterium]